MKRKQYNWTLPQKIKDRLGDSSYGKQRVIYEENHLLLILHEPPKQDENKREYRIFLRTPEDKLLCNGEDNGEYKLRSLLKRYLETYSRLDDLYENSQSSESLFDIIEETTPVNRSIQNLAKTLQDARTIIKEDAFIISMRDEAYDLARNYELLLADSKLALDFRIAKNTELQSAEASQMAKAQHKLNTLAAITFPLMALATLFGMNLRHGFEDAPIAYFWIIMIVGFLTGFLVKSWSTK